MASPYIEQIEQNIHALIADGKFQEAYKMIQKLIAENPGVEEFQDLKVRFEKAVAKENQNIVERRLEETDHLWEEKRYDQILKELRDLLKFDPENNKLKRLYQKAQDKYRDQLEESNKLYRQQSEKRLEDLLRNDIQSLEEELFRMDSNNPGNPAVQAITSRYRDALIKKIIDQKEELIRSDNFRDIQNLISRLKNIQQNNPRVLELEKSIKRRVLDSQIDNQKEFIYRSYDQLQTLMKLEKYDKAIQAAEEILRQNPRHQEVQRILAKAKKKLFSSTQKTVIQQIKDKFKDLKAEYLKDKSRFVKI